VARLVLASASPRRRDFLDRLGVAFTVRPPDIVERTPTAGDPQIIARRLAREKVEAARLVDEHAPIIAADTVVEMDGRILDKPADAEEARETLQLLRGRTHRVVTAVAFMPLGKRAPLARHPVTRVTMREYEDAEIDASIARGDPFDKAGAYAIQDSVLNPVATYDGCYCNVVGLSLWATIEIMLKAGERLDAAAVDFLPQCRDCPLAVR
jgi:MAF protein